MDKPSTPLQHDAIRKAAEHRVGYLRWLAEHLEPPKYNCTLPAVREDIRKAAAHELRQLAGES